MKKLLIITDSNSGITQKESKELGIIVIPMPFFIDGVEYLEEITLSQEDFYKHLENSSNISTSQPSLYYLEELFTKYLKEYEDIIYIPMSSGLSATCSNATKLAESFKNKVHVIDNLRISVTLKESIYEAISMQKNNKHVEEIVKYLTDTRSLNSIYICVDTLKYLKKGGRVKPSVAAIADLFKIKPILFSKGDKFEAFSNCRSLKMAKDKMIKQVKKELETEYKDYYEKGLMTVSVAHTLNYQEAINFKEQIISEIPNIKFRFVDPLSLSVTCHIGPKSLAIALSINSFLND